MVTECRHCQAVVDGIEVASYETFDDDSHVPVKFTLAKCPRCAAPLLLVQEQWGDRWDKPSRIFPVRDDLVGFSVPKPIRNAFAEAARCLNAKSFTAAAIMCRRTLEGVCADHKVDGSSLQRRLAALRDSGIIEGRLFQWADELRLVGNEAAHEVSVEVSPQDASDTLDFTRAVLEYVYTFRDQFQRFQQRRKKAEEGTKPAPIEVLPVPPKS
jgi:hypothetical protein